jgi:hypothetical protein
MSTPDMTVDEVFEGRDAETVVAAAKAVVAGRMSFLLRPFVNSMGPLAFAQEVVSRYNAATGKSLPRPATCEEFLKLGETEGLVTFLSVVDRRLR